MDLGETVGKFLFSAMFPNMLAPGTSQGGLQGGHKVGARPGGRARPHPCGCLGTLLVHLRYFVGFFWSKNNLRQILGQLDSVWFSFSAILKKKEKTKTCT